MRYVKSVEAIVPYKLKVAFDNNETKIIDMSGFLHRKIYAPLQDWEFFKRVRVDADLDTIVWENGADICPNVLYEMGREVFEDQALAVVEA